MGSVSLLADELEALTGLAEDGGEEEVEEEARVSSCFGRLRPGVEVDYNVVDAYWLPARVVLAAEGGSLVAVRFAVGGADVTHAVDTCAPGVAARFAAVGTRSCPVVAGQPVDVLRQQDAAGILGPSQQWQRGTSRPFSVWRRAVLTSPVTHPVHPHAPPRVQAK